MHRLRLGKIFSKGQTPGHCQHGDDVGSGCDGRERVSPVMLYNSIAQDALVAHYRGSCSSGECCRFGSLSDSHLLFCCTR
jgi:hypothetical protein